MNRLHSTVAHLRVVGRCVLTGALAAMLATQSFAQAEHAGNTPTPAASVSAESLPDAPAAASSSSADQPAGAAMLADDATQNTLTSTPQKPRHKVHPGWLVLGIAGGAAAGMGAYIFSLKTSNTGAKTALGTMFLAPGAAAAGLGFYFAFK
jgi:hypothetical protein